MIKPLYNYFPFYCVKCKRKYKINEREIACIEYYGFCCAYCGGEIKEEIKNDKI